MRNVVSITTRRIEVANQPIKGDDANDFMTNFYDWAYAQGVDTSSVQFKFDAATILTVIQSILHKKD